MNRHRSAERSEDYLWLASEHLGTAERFAHRVAHPWRHILKTHTPDPRPHPAFFNKASYSSPEGHRLVVLLLALDVFDQIVLLCQRMRERPISRLPTCETGERAGAFDPFGRERFSLSFTRSASAIDGCNVISICT